MIKQRIIQYLDLKGVTKYRFYKDVQVATGYLDNDGSIQSAIIEKILSKYPDLNLYWLITGVGEMIKKDTVAEATNIDYKEKYIETVEKYNQCLEEKDKMRKSFSHTQHDNKKSNIPKLK